MKTVCNEFIDLKCKLIGTVVVIALLEFIVTGAI